jgi:predicted nuclease with RNAse H fold
MPQMGEPQKNVSETGAIRKTAKNAARIALSRTALVVNVKRSFHSAHAIERTTQEAFNVTGGLIRYLAKSQGADRRCVRVLGIDVSVQRGMDLVALEQAEVQQAGPYRILGCRHHADAKEVWMFCAALKPDCVAVDSPPSWARSGRSRAGERALLSEGVHSFFTPCETEGVGNAFYEWMRVGFKVFRTLASKFPRYSKGSVEGTAIEVFPYATAFFLCGGPKPKNLGKVRWRRQILRRLGVEEALLSNVDQVDAALAAVTGAYALRGDFKAFGDPDEGVIVVPGSQITKPS